MELARAHRALDKMARLPLLRGHFVRAYDRAFEANRKLNLFRGVFDSFGAALASAPGTLPTGYDNEAAAGMYVDRTRKIYPTDYPVIYWLERIFAEGCTTLFDVGGHIGVSYYSYQRYLRYPAGLSWVVHDVPAVMEAGRKFAQERDAERCLGFSDDFSGASGMDVLFALGSLQYLPETLGQRLAQLTELPKHIVLNLTPLHASQSYFTLQGIGTAYCAYRITAIPEFLRAIESLGYRLVDQWDNPDKKCEIPFYPEQSLDRYYGFYFRREQAAVTN